ncbi:hypothetical protein IQ06DRAFT_63486 [Phaeosphaeriaceae sp. SRC1lsM3a]|nr:hypothetical protein IQ06DRAFT_63486 [Stagonospora sp. SRC1lsM3a]
METRFHDHRNYQPTSQGRWPQRATVLSAQPHKPEGGDFGLFPLTGPNTGSRLKATIVAIHGVSGHYMRTWTHTQSVPPFMWIKDGLGEDLSDCRILSYGYDASVSARWSSPQRSLFDHATNLHNLLQDYLQKEGAFHPVIFIAHNVGGILVKLVLVQSALKAPSIVHKSTAAILFFGTPHRDYSSASMARRLVSSVDGTPSLAGWEPSSSMSMLFKDSRTLRLIDESWMHLHHSYQIYSFYETRASSLGMSSSLV